MGQDIADLGIPNHVFVHIGKDKADLGIPNHVFVHMGQGIADLGIYPIMYRYTWGRTLQICIVWYCVSLRYNMLRCIFQSCSPVSQVILGAPIDTNETTFGISNLDLVS